MFKIVDNKPLFLSKWVKYNSTAKSTKRKAYFCQIFSEIEALEIDYLKIVMSI